MTTVNVSRSLITALRAQLRMLANKDPAVFGTGTSDDCPPWPIIEEMIHDLTKALAPEQPSEGDVGRDVLNAIKHTDVVRDTISTEASDHFLIHRRDYELIRFAALATTPPQEPDGWALRYTEPDEGCDKPNWAGVWNNRKIAEDVKAAPGNSRSKMEIVGVFTRPLANDKAVRRIEGALKYNKNRDTYTEHDETFRRGCVHGLERALEFLTTHNAQGGE